MEVENHVVRNGRNTVAASSNLARASGFESELDTQFTPAQKHSPPKATDQGTKSETAIANTKEVSVSLGDVYFEDLHPLVRYPLVGAGATAFIAPLAVVGGVVGGLLGVPLSSAASTIAPALTVPVFAASVAAGAIGVAGYWINNILKARAEGGRETASVQP